MPCNIALLFCLVASVSPANAQRCVAQDATPARPHAARTYYINRAYLINCTYYVNSDKGDDRNAGTSPRQPWKTVARANSATYFAGDRLLFAGGQTFAGSVGINRQESGTARQPIVISSYGHGRATINAGVTDGCVLTDCAYVRIENLNFVGSGRKNGSNGTGLHLVRTRNVSLDRIDVSGFRNAGVAAGGDENTRITQVNAHDNGFAGITTDGGYGDVPRTRNLYIGYSNADNNPGDPKNLTNHSGNGIVVGALDGGMIEYCEASNNGWDMPRDGNGPVGIWGWNCDRLIIQHCISHDNKSPGTDGGGFDFDGGVTNSILQYNLSYHNMGCGYLLCQYPGASLWKNNVMRYNISIDDGTKNFHSGIGLWIGGGDFSDAQIYNNTIVNTQHAVSTLGDVPGFLYRNNIFLTGSHVIDATLGGSYNKSRFENNLYWSTQNGGVYRDEKAAYTTLTEWTRATNQEIADGKMIGIWADPKLQMPSDGDKLPTDPRQLQMLRFYQPGPGSPAHGFGTPHM